MNVHKSRRVGFSEQNFELELRKVCLYSRDRHEEIQNRIGSDRGGVLKFPMFAVNFRNSRSYHKILKFSVNFLKNAPKKMVL